MVEGIAQTAWYHQGNWPLFGALAVLTITNALSIWRIFITAERSIKNQLVLNEIQRVGQQLNEFYDPIYALLLVNSHVFRAAGPSTFPEETHRREAAAEVWNRAKKSVILPNLGRIEEIVRTKSHLAEPGDSLIDYIPLLNHIAMYGIFQEYPTELYVRFKYPEGILRHVEKFREELIIKLQKTREVDVP